MVKIAEVVLEITAEGFTNTGRRTKGRVVQDLNDAGFSIQVDDQVRKVTLPTGPFATKDEAKKSLLEYWAKCEEELISSGGPSWQPKV